MLEKIYRLSPQRRKQYGFFISLTVSCLISLSVFSIPTIDILQWRLADFWAEMRYPIRVSEKVCVVGIDDDLFEKQGFEWPLDKDVYGELIDYLTEMGAKVIAFDILFSDNLYDCGKGDSIFIGMLSESPRVILTYAFLVMDRFENNIVGIRKNISDRFSIGRGEIPGYSVFGTILPYQQLLTAVHQCGFINRSVPFRDGIDRKMPLVISQDSLIYPSLALLAASQWKGNAKIAWDTEKKSVWLGNQMIATDVRGNIHVNFSDSIPEYSLSEIVYSHQEWLLGNEPPIGKDELEGRIVFIGNTAMSLGDLGITPLSKRVPGGRSPNVLMHARSTSTMLEQDVIRYYSRAGSLIFLCILTGIVVVLFMFIPAKFLLVVVPVLLILGYFTGNWLYNIQYFVPVLEGLFNALLFSLLGAFVIYLEKDIDNRFLYATFKTYLSPDYIDEMARKHIKPKLGGEKVYATAFFTDIENFTTFSADLEPEALIEILNQYFPTMTNILLAQNGTLDKFIGDAIVAFFGAPKRSKTHAYDACKVAVKMQVALAGLRKKWSEREDVHDRVKDLKMRIGINTGEFVTGNIGCDFRMNYTMIGDDVNVAARLESGGKEYGVYTVIGENTYEQVKDKFLLRLLDKIRVKGRDKPVKIYQLLGIPRENDKQSYELISCYEKALEEYFNRNFKEAMRQFEAADKKERYPKGNDPDLINPSFVMNQRCAGYLADPPPEDWDGVFRFTHK